MPRHAHTTITSLPEHLGWQSTFLDLPRLGRMHVVQAGPESGPPVILLHGFPDFWYGWCHQIRALAAAGYRVLAPDQRGYNLTAKRGPHNLDAVTVDVLALIEALRYDRVRLVGHDWGGAVAWMFAAMYPQRLDRLAVLNLPHPLAALHRFGRFDPRQLLRSWYIGAIQLPLLPEALLRHDHFAGMRAPLRASARPGAFTDEDLAHYTTAWSQPGALAGMLAWYRAIWVTRRQVIANRRRLALITPPTLVLWGERDMALVPEFAAESGPYLAHGRVITLPEATHWLHLEFPDTVNQHLLEHFE